MKYFAEYIGVPDEVQVGLLFKANHNHSVGVVETIEDEGERTRVIYLCEGGQKRWTLKSMGSVVKLFLCSRDIQVNDLVTNIDTGKERNITTKAELSLAQMQIGVLVKVIGEISHEATFVKEGDEFEEDNWEYAWRYPITGEFTLADKKRGYVTTMSDSKRNKEFIIGIKCPCCGTFK
jgi:hypothetical protein